MSREQFAIGCVILAAVAVVSLLAGIWWGRRDGADEIAALEADLEESQAKVGRWEIKRWRPELSHDETWQGGRGESGDRSLPSAALPPEPTDVIPPDESDTAFMRRITARLEREMAALMDGSEPWLREMTR